MIKKMTAVLAASFISGAAIAETDQTTPSAPESTSQIDWSGAYAGAALTGSDGDYGNDIGEGDISGVGIAAILGYNLQNEQYVYGAELQIAAPNADGSTSCANPAWTCAADLQSSVSLMLRGGMLVRQDLLLYATAGITHGRLEAWTDNGTTIFPDTQSITAGAFGVGLEKALNDKTRLRGEIIHRVFGGEDFMADVPYEDIETTVTSLNIGVVFSF
jgi:outer membrane immunogenic protein